MDPDLKARWTAALRSPDYTQGRGYLCTKTETGFAHCCLGVLCDIAGLTRNVPELFQPAAYDELTSTAALSDTILKRLGLTAAQQDLLIGKNDGISGAGGHLERQTFAEIADYIDAEL